MIRTARFSPRSRITSTATSPSDTAASLSNEVSSKRGIRSRSSRVKTGRSDMVLLDPVKVGLDGPRAQPIAGKPGVMEFQGRQAFCSADMVITHAPEAHTNWIEARRQER